jgi:hypothetical protein
LQWTIKILSPLFSIFSLVAILVGSQDHRTHFWKGAIQGPFHQSFFQIGPEAYRVASVTSIMSLFISFHMLTSDDIVFQRNTFLAHLTQRVM